MWPLWLVEMSLQHIQKKIPQDYCIHLPNLKRIRPTVTELWGKENTALTELKEPAEPDILPYTNKRPARDAILM